MPYVPSERPSRSYAPYGDRRGGYSGGHNHGGSGSYESRGSYGRSYGGHSRGSYGRGRERGYSSYQDEAEKPVEELFKAQSLQGIDFNNYDKIPVEVKGENVPKSVSSFEEMNLPKELLDNIECCGYKKPTPVQKHAVVYANHARDLMVTAQTGSGKTAGFLFPLITQLIKTERKVKSTPIGVILSPTRELATQIYDEARKFTYRTHLRVCVVYGGKNIGHQIRQLRRGVDIIVATPGRLCDLIGRGVTTMRDVTYLILDEADRMLDMGFEPQIRQIVEQEKMPSCDNRQTMMFSATFPKDIRILASEFLKQNYIFMSVGIVGSTTSSITQEVLWVEQFDKGEKLLEFIEKGEKTLVFVRMKRDCDDIQFKLRSGGHQAETIHGDKRQEQRERALRMFKQGRVHILVATDVAARGLDIRGVAHVINYDMPENLDSYIHRIGRTGRAGHKGKATSFFNSNQSMMAKPLLKTLIDSKQKIPEWLESYVAEVRNKKKKGRGGRRGGGRNGGGRYGGYGGHGGHGGGRRFGGNSYGNRGPSYGSFNAYGGSPSGPSSGPSGGSFDPFGGFQGGF